MTHIYGQEKPSLEEVLAHHGTKGMRWGVRKEKESAADKAFRKEASKQYRKNYSNTVLENRLNRSFGKGMTSEEYAKLSTKDVTVRKGTEIHRVVGNKNADITGPLYVSVSKRDAEIYRAVMPQTNQAFRNKGYNQHEITYKAVGALRSPSEKARVDAFIHLMDSPEIQLRNGKMITGRELLKRQGYGRSIKKMDSTRLGLKYYHEFASTQGMPNAPINSAYFKRLKEQGYNAVVDDHDRLIVSHEPMIVLDHGVLRNTGVRQLTDREIFEAKRSIKPPTRP